MEPRIETLIPKTLVGMAREMSMVKDETSQLWRGFRPRIAEVTNRTTAESISMRVYSGSTAEVFEPNASFRQWAAVEVVDHDDVPEGMEPYLLGGGTYAVFVHRGPANDLSTFRYIFSDWLPASDYILDDREHFEVLPANYDPRDPDATEECWIPVRLQEAED